jgi:hypothetical protein
MKNAIFEELKAWADKWNVKYRIHESETCIYIFFDSISHEDPTFSYNKKTGNYTWYGGD